MSFFKKKPQVATAADLQRIRNEFDKRTADYHGEDIWELSDFLMLLNLADNDVMGKSKSIIYAYKLGYMNGAKRTLGKIKEYIAGKDGNASE